MRYLARVEVGRYGWCAWLFALLTFPPSFAAETGNVCVHQHAPGITCSGTDVAISALVPVTILEDCPSGDPDTVEAIFNLWVSAGATRYDVGLYLALNGGSALEGGQCLHDYLEPPLSTTPTYTDIDLDGTQEIVNGPWWNGEPFVPADDCGDMESSTDIVKTITLRIACVDTNLDDSVDVSTCASWSTGTQSTCPNLSGAVAGAGSRCLCARVETGIPVAGPETPSGGVGGLSVDRDGNGDLLLSWDASCAAGDTDYAVYEGVLGDWDSHQSIFCSTNGMTSVAIQPRPEDAYYLIVPRNASREGSYGLTSAPAERPAAIGACLPQLTSGCQ